jgi:hypothetical protein
MENTLLIRPEKRFFSTPELISFLRDYAGMTISKSTAFKWSMLGKIPCQKAPNGRLLFPVDEVRRWIESGYSGCSGEHSETKHPEA